MVAVTVQLSREFQDRALAPPRRMPRLIEKLQDRMSISLLRHGAAGFFSRGTSRTAQRRAQSFAVGTIEGLEKRLAMSATTAATPAIQMLSATTTDSKSVTIEYQVNQAPDAANPIQFGVYRSSNGQFDSSDSLVDTITLAVPGSASGA